MLPLEGTQVVLTEDTLCVAPPADGAYYRPNSVPALLTPFALARVAAPMCAHPQITIGELAHLYSSRSATTSTSTSTSTSMSTSTTESADGSAGEVDADPDDEDALMERVHVASLARDPLELVLRRLVRALTKGHLLVLTDLRPDTELDPRLLKALHVRNINWIFLTATNYIYLKYC